MEIIWGSATRAHSHGREMPAAAPSRDGQTRGEIAPARLAEFGLGTRLVQCDNGNENLGRFADELKRRGVRVTYGKPSAPASQALAERLG